MLIGKFYATLFTRKYILSGSGYVSLRTKRKGKRCALNGARHGEKGKGVIAKAFSTKQMPHQPQTEVILANRRLSRLPSVQKCVTQMNPGSTPDTTSHIPLCATHRGTPPLQPLPPLPPGPPSSALEGQPKAIDFIISSVSTSRNCSIVRSVAPGLTSVAFGTL